MSADLRELAALIRTLRPEQREALADDLATISGARPAGMPRARGAT